MIVETPPSPVGRAIAFTIIAVFSVAIAWACLGTVDIVAVAPGKIIPSGRTKTIQPLHRGIGTGISGRSFSLCPVDDDIVCFLNDGRGKCRRSIR